MDAVHLDGVEIASLGMADELEEIELGDRVACELEMERFITAFAPEDRTWQMSLLLLSRLSRSGMDATVLDDMVVQAVANYEMAHS